MADHLKTVHLMMEKKSVQPKMVTKVVMLLGLSKILVKFKAEHLVELVKQFWLPPYLLLYNIFETSKE